MTDFIELAVAPREDRGKTSRRLAREGLVPAVLYGAGVANTIISLPRHEFELLRTREAIGARILEVRIEGQKDTVNAIVKDIQLHPVSGHVLHVDLLAVDMKETIQAPVPLEFVGDSEGVKEGGIFTHNLLEVLVEALPADLPDHIQVEVSQLDIGDNLTVADVVAPEGATILDELETVVCSITLPTKIVEEVEELEELDEEGLVPEIGEEGAPAEEGGERSAEAREY